MLNEFSIVSNILYVFCFIAGKTRARDAALNAIQSPLLDIGIERATGIVWNITGGTDLTLFEVPISLSIRPVSSIFIIYLDF